MNCLIITTCNKEDEKKIICSLLNKNMVACINSFNVNSSYVWKEKIEKDEEKILMIKTTKNMYRAVEREIKRCHSYEIPEIICIDIKKGYDRYLQWIEKVVK